MADATETKIFEGRVQSRRWLLGLSAFMGVLSIFVFPLGAHIARVCLAYAYLCAGLAGFRSVFACEGRALHVRLYWLCWPVPKLVLHPRLFPKRALRAGPSLARPGRWSVHMTGLGAFEYASERKMEADIQVLRALFPTLPIVRDEVDVPRKAMAAPIVERCQRVRKDFLKMAAAYLVAALPCAAFGQDFLTGMCLVFAGLIAWLAGFRVTYTLTGTRLTETLHWFGWPFPRWFRYGLPKGVGMLREVVCTWVAERHTWQVNLHTSGGVGTCGYREEAMMQADLDELRALCPRVPIVRR